MENKKGNLSEEEMKALAKMAGIEDSVMTKKHTDKLNTKELAEALYEGTPHLQNLAEKLARHYSGAGALCFYSQQYPEVKKFYEKIAQMLIDHACGWEPRQSGGCELKPNELQRLKTNY